MTDTNAICHEGTHTVFTEAFSRIHKKDDSSLRPCILFLGGVMRGVYGGGGARALERAGLSEAFYAGVGVSTGAPALAYFLAKQAGVGTSIYYEECTTWRFLRPFGHNITDISFLSDVWRGKKGEKKLDVYALQKNPTRSYALATPVAGGASRMLSYREEHDPIECIVAACSMSGLYHGTPMVHGVEYTDAAMADPFPIERLVEVFSPTSVLVIANRPKVWRDVRWAVALYDLFVRYVLRHTEHVSAKEKHRRYEASLTWIRSVGIPYCIVYTDDEVRPFTRNAAKLKDAADRFEAYMTRLLRAARENIQHAVE